MSLTWPIKHFTLAEWSALPETDEARLELVEGLVVMTPTPLSWHQRAAMRLGYRLDDQLPADLTAIAALEVLITDPPPTVRIPDVVVARGDVVDGNRPRVAAEDVRLAVEVLSDGTRRVDRVLKLSEYADAGILQYWIIDIDAPTTLLAYTLVDGDYELFGEHTGRTELTVAGHPVTLDLDALTRR